MNKNIFSELGANVFGLRLQNRLTQQQLADKVGTTRQTIAKIERGDGDTVAIGTWARILDVCGYRFNIERIILTLQNVAPAEIDSDYDPLDGYVSWIGNGD